MTLTIAFNYGGRAEIVDAVRALVAEGAPADKIDEKAIRRHLYDPDMPDPDLVIRTSGEYRISNFLLWELAYSELVFTDVLWPDFRREHLAEAVREYQRRDRRFGGVDREAGRMSLYRDTGVVLRTYKLGEADRIVVLLTAEHGKVRAVAKGVRKTKSRFGGRLEPLSHVALLLYEGRELDIVTQAESIDHLRAIREDLDRLTRASPCSRSSTSWRQEREPDPRSSTRCSSARCARWPRSRATARGAGLLLEGAGPRRASAPSSTPACAAARRTPLVAFDLDEGGALCRTCRQGRADLAPRRSRCCAASSAASWSPRSPSRRRPPRHEVTMLATRAMEHHLERRLRVVALLERH